MAATMTRTMTGATVRRTGRLPTVRRLGWGVADQAVSSLENFLLGVYVARSLGAESLGALGLATVTYAIVLNISRGLSTDPLMVRFSGVPGSRWRPAVASSSGTALVVGALSGLACAGIGAVLLTGLLTGSEHTGMGAAFVFLGLGLPGLVLQDSWRYAFFSSGQGAKAFTNDVVWTVLLMALLPLGGLVGMTGVAWAVLAFGASASLAALFGLVQARVLPRPGRTTAWLRHQRDLGWRFLVENVTLGAGSQILSFVVAAVAGLAAVGEIRGAQMLTGPIVALLMGIAQVAVPETVRGLAGGRTVFIRLCVMLSLGLGSLSLLWGLVLLVVFPHGIGESLLGSVWVGTQVLVPAVVVSSTAGCLHVGPSAGLRALGRADRTMRSQLAVTLLYVSLGTAGTVLWGAAGMVWGAAAAVIIGAAIWWARLGEAEREHFAGADPSVDTGADTGADPGAHGGAARTGESVDQPAG